MSFKCSGCGETHPDDSGLTFRDVLVYEDGEYREVDKVRLCPDCRGREARQ